MEAAAKIAIYLTLGLALLSCNIWFARSVYHSLTGGDLVVAPVKVVGGKGDTAIMGETLARLIISKLQSLEWDLRQSQSALRPEDATLKDAKKPDGAVPAAAKPSGVTAGILGTPKTAVLNAQLFEPTNIDV